MPNDSATRRGGGVGIEVRGLVAGYGGRPVLREIDVDVAGGEVLALLGPSGCGKTTLLRCIAGLERPTSGSIMIGGEDVTSGRGVPAERRKVGMVFQDGALFPHRSVINNVNYGLARGDDRERRALDAIRLVGLEDKRDRMPGTLSGGEQQRVALARALAPEPGVVLLDEPFSSLDAALRSQLRDEVRRLLSNVGVTTILVTHDQEEAMSFGDRVAVMNAGVIEQIGTPEDVYSAPATPWVARFVGEAILLPSTFDGVDAQTPLGAMTMRTSRRGGGTVVLRPEQLTVTAEGDAVVEAVQYFGADTRYEIAVVGFDVPIVARCPGSPQHSLGDRVSVMVAPGKVVHAWADDAE